MTFLFAHEFGPYRYLLGFSFLFGLAIAGFVLLSIWILKDKD
jgi:hypothetical protein